MVTPELIQTEAWDPFARVSRIQKQIDSLFNGNGAGTKPTVFPPIDVWAGEDRVIVVAQVPGMGPDDLNVTVNGKVLTLEGERREEVPAIASTPIHRERWFGKFSRKVELPFPVDPEQTRATSKNGLLWIEMNRAEEDKPKRIQITTQPAGGEQ